MRSIQASCVAASTLLLVKHDEGEELEWVVSHDYAVGVAVVLVVSGRVAAEVRGDHRFEVR